MGQATYRGGRLVSLVATLILCVLAFQLNASMLTPALPSIAASMNVSVDLMSNVSSLFFLASSIGGVVLARWSDFIGRRRALIIVLLTLTVGTILCIFATNLTILLIGRVLQGASGATFQIAYVFLREKLDTKTFGIVLGILTAVNGGVGGFDGYLGGVLSDKYGFQSIFIVILAIVVFTLICVMLVVPKEDSAVTTGKMDWWGSGALSVGLILLTYFVAQGSAVGWFAPITLIFLVGMVISFIVFWYIEKRSASPMIAVQHLRSRQVWPVVTSTLLCLTGIFAVINFTVVLLSQDQEVGFGLDAAMSGLLFLTPAALIGVFAAPISGWLAGRFGWIRMLRLGILVSIAALVAILLFTGSKWIVFSAVALLGITYNGLILTTINGLGVLQSPDEAPSALPGINGAGFGVGASLGIGLVAPFVGQGTLGGYTTAMWVSIIITVLALVSSLLIVPKNGQKV
ncbi:MFS transporter [Paenibacillus lentus]|uniref:MFS transporter n=1 Tax=Paenibacillus lentus TaxID=1338368 RepID=A0A3Q8S9Q2_9BACL|nr:MFS transporter [Paenibacillus lentus]AZK45663.1 MFS transporter [Paenibacillus lentus]